MGKEKCKYYESCNAPLCPFDEESIEHGIWYPDEEVCRKKTSIKWIRRQKTLIKRKVDPEGYFTTEMLLTRTKFGKNPDTPIRLEKTKDKKIE